MLALRVESLEEKPEWREIPIPSPSKNEVLVRIEACGLNFADLLLMKGNYQEKPALPFTLGMELAGRVMQVGPAVTGLNEGQKVAVYSGQGGLAEYGVFDSSRCTRIPDGLSILHVAGFQIAYGTSHLALDHKARLQPNEKLVVLGAAGGVGLTAVEIGKAMGASVIAVARGEQKLGAAAQAGADYLIDSDIGDLKEQVKELGGADVVYDPVGGDQFNDIFRACNPDGRILVIGFASGKIPEVKANHLMVKNIAVIGLNWGGFLKFNPEVQRKSLATLLDWYAKGKLSPQINTTLPFCDALSGFELLKSRKSTGKVVIKIT